MSKDLDPNDSQNEKRLELMNYLPGRQSNMKQKKPTISPDSPSRSARRIGSFIYFLGMVGLTIVGILLWVADNIRYREFPHATQLNGIQSEVTVVWDGSGTVHLHGESWEDLLRAQGWFHARDRLWQMEGTRLAGQGRLAELIGPLALGADKVLRTLDLVKAASDQVARLPEKSRHLIQHYVDGINAYLDSDEYQPPPELFLLGWSPERWTIESSALITVVLSLALSSNWAQEAVVASLEAGFDTADVALLLPDSVERPYIIEKLEAGFSEDQDYAGAGSYLGDSHSAGITSEQWSRLAGGIRLFRNLLDFGDSGGSNSWVVSGEHTGTGKPLLANDPHLAIQIPSMFLSIGLHVGNRHLVGIGMPGLPLIMNGRSSTFAWALTNSMADNQDLYIERPVDGDPDRYWFRGETYPFSVRREILEVRWGKPEVVEIRSTLHGPIINDVLLDMLHAEQALSRLDGEKEVAGNGRARSDDVEGWLEGSPPIALRWSTLDTGDELHSLISLLDVEDWAGLREAFASLGSPGQNVIYADTSGFIGYQFTGRVPVRHGWDGSRPVPGWTGDYEWQGYIPYDQLPRLENPEQGWLVTANNRPVAPGTGPFLSRWWVPPHRARRIGELLAQSEYHTPETFENIQRDLRSEGALEIVADLARVQALSPAGRQALAILGEWDGRIDLNGAGALYEAFVTGFFPGLLEDELGSNGLLDYLVLLEFYDGRYPVIRRMLQHPDSPWWDDVGTEDREGRDEIVDRILRSAFEEITSEYGPDPHRWQWGRRHSLLMRHPFGYLWFFKGLFNRGPFDMAGDNDTIYNSHYLLSDPYATQVVSAWRHIVDLSWPPQARQIMSSGNSGHFLAVSYDDQIEEWLAGLTRPAATTWQQVLAAETRRMRLLP